MSRIMARCTLTAILAALGGAAAFAQDNPPERFSHREIRGPKGLPDRRSIFAHLDSVVFTPDSTKMAAGAGAAVFIWDAADGKEIVRMQLPEQQIYHRLAFAKDGKTLVWCGREDPMIRVFDAATGRQLREFRQPNAGGKGRESFSSHFLAFSPDGKRMAFNGPAFFQGLDLLDVATGKISLSIKEQKDCRGCAFSPDGKLLAAHSGNGGLHLWNAETGKLVRQLHPDDRFGGGAYKFVTFSPDGKFLASGGHSREGLDVWNAGTGKLLCSVPTKTYFYSVAFAPDGQSLVCVEADGRPYLYHLIAEKVICRFNPPERLCHFVRFSPDFKRVALIAEATDRDPNARQEAIFLYEVPSRALNPPAAQVDDAALEKLWAELDTDNGLRLQRVQGAFRSAPQPAVALFRKKLPPVSKEQLAKAEQWIAGLDDPAFTKRDEAMKDLQQVANQFAPLLKARREQAAPGEIRNRLTFVLKQMEAEPLPAALVRDLRVLTLLEQMATPEARELLTKVAEGAAQARVTEEARSALERLTKSKKAEK